MSKYFRANHSHIETFMNFDCLFLLLSELTNRIKILNKLLKISKWLILLHTLAQDTLMIKSCARAFRNIFLKRFKSILSKVMLNYYVTYEINFKNFKIQIAKHKFTKISISFHAVFVLFIQLFLFAMKHFVNSEFDEIFMQRLEWLITSCCLTHMTILTNKWEFFLNQIRKLCFEKMNITIVEQLLRSICIENFYVIDNQMINEIVSRVKNLLKKLYKRKEKTQNFSIFSINDQDSQSSKWYNNSLVKKYLFDRLHYFIN